MPQTLAFDFLERLGITRVGVAHDAESRIVGHRQIEALFRLAGIAVGEKVAEGPISGNRRATAMPPPSRLTASVRVNVVRVVGAPIPGPGYSIENGISVRNPGMGVDAG